MESNHPNNHPPRNQCSCFNRMTSFAFCGLSDVQSVNHPCYHQPVRVRGLLDAGVIFLMYRNQDLLDRGESSDGELHTILSKVGSDFRYVLAQSLCTRSSVPPNPKVACLFLIL